MHINNNSLAIVLIGDWNKIYTEPEWIAKNIFKQSEIEVRVTFTNSDASLYCLAKNIIVESRTDRVVFTSKNDEKESINALVVCVNNFLLSAKSPVKVSFGYNTEYSEDNSMVFAEYLDSLPDTGTFIEEGYEIKKTDIKRVIVSDGILLNIDFRMNGPHLTVHFNEHHDKLPDGDSISSEKLIGFIERSKRILIALGYSMESDDDD